MKKPMNARPSTDAFMMISHKSSESDEFLAGAVTKIGVYRNEIVLPIEVTNFWQAKDFSALSRPKLLASKG
jgi:hypothetical protein